jgi:hypothetical protein
MTRTWIVLSLALSLALAAFMAAPLFEASANGALIDSRNNDLYRQLADKKEVALRLCKDLELDYSMGKVSHDEYLRSKDELSLEMAQILKELSRHE